MHKINSLRYFRLSVAKMKIKVTTSTYFFRVGFIVVVVVALVLVFYLTVYKQSNL